jgi:hypothetical protein
MLTKSGGLQWTGANYSTANGTQGKKHCFAKIQGNDRKVLGLSSPFIVP